MKTQAIPSLDDLLREDRKVHTERQDVGGIEVGAFHQNEQEVATQAIDIEALIAARPGGERDPVASGMSALIRQGVADPNEALATERVDVAAAERAVRENAATVQDSSVADLLASSTPKKEQNPTPSPPKQVSAPPVADAEPASAAAPTPSTFGAPSVAQESVGNAKGNKKVWVLVGVFAFALLVCCPGSLFGAYKAGLFPVGLTSSSDTPETSEPPKEAEPSESDP